MTAINKSPFVSIITPCFNAENSISETIESVINQTYTNWELIIIDDCSNDKSLDIIQNYAKKDDRIRYFKTDSPSGSPSIPRNIGLDNANGDYIAFLDADDIWLPEKLDRQIGYAKPNDYQFIYSNYEKINSIGERSNRIITLPKKSTFWDVIETCTIPCLTVLLHANVIGNTRFRPIEKEDFAFWLDILKKNVVAYNCNETLALYREQNKSRSSNKFNMIKSQWKFLRHIEGVKPFVASYFMCIYLIHGFIKYLK